MASLRVQNLTFAFSDAVPLFEKAAFHLSSGWTGLVGANGAGKSTLLLLLGGHLPPASGQILFEPVSRRVAYCPQSVEALSREIERFAKSTEPMARRAQGQLRLSLSQIDNWTSLSPGERKRWQIGAAIAVEPDVLLLDEPTNHLDSQAREWLISVLLQFKGIGLVVSHDRTLLDELTENTLRIHSQEIRLWSGCYSRAKNDWEVEKASHHQVREKAKEEHRHTLRQLDEARRWQKAAATKSRASHRMKDKHDHDARSMGAQITADWADARQGQRVRNLRGQAERTANAVGEYTPDKTLGRSVFVDYERAPGQFLFTLENQSLSLGGKRLLDPVTLTVERDSRIWIAGANGAGKTTLLNTLLLHARVPLGRVLYLPQELESDQAVHVLNTVRSLPVQERGRVLSLVAALGVDPDRLLASQMPSPGEARKLLMAQGLGQHVWCLVLDEPTNHLDLPSIERLEAALSEYPGALMLVTHDEKFARKCVTEKWHIADFKIFKQSVDDHHD